jgi:uncharacterized protein with HEPN domain
MRPSAGDSAYLWDMREAGREILVFVQGASFDSFASDRQLRLAVERELEIIGEAARHVSPGFQQAHPEIPWRAIIGQRNLLAHEYGEIRVERIWVVVESGIGTLIKHLDVLLEGE